MTDFHGAEFWSMSDSDSSVDNSCMMLYNEKQSKEPGVNTRSQTAHGSRTTAPIDPPRSSSRTAKLRSSSRTRPGRTIYPDDSWYSRPNTRPLGHRPAYDKMHESNIEVVSAQINELIAQNYKPKINECMPKPFDGIHKKDPIAHLASVNDYFKIQGLTEDSEKLDRFKLTLEEAPKRWIDSITPETMEECKECK